MSTYTPGGTNGTVNIPTNLLRTLERGFSQPKGRGILRKPSKAEAEFTAAVNGVIAAIDSPNGRGLTGLKTFFRDPEMTIVSREDAASLRDSLGRFAESGRVTKGLRDERSKFRFRGIVAAAVITVLFSPVLAIAALPGGLLLPPALGVWAALLAPTTLWYGRKVMNRTAGVRSQVAELTRRQGPIKAVAADALVKDNYTTRVATEFGPGLGAGRDVTGSRGGPAVRTAEDVVWPGFAADAAVDLAGADLDLTDGGRRRGGSVVDRNDTAGEGVTPVRGNSWSGAGNDSTADGSLGGPGD